MCGPVNPVGSFFREVLDVLRIPYIAGRDGELGTFVNLFVQTDGGGTSFNGGFWYDLLGGAWTLGVWGFFGQAIHRITSLRIARDEGMSLKAGLGFSIRNFVTIALCPVIVAVAIGIFYGCNALAGALISIPVLGGILAILLVPLALIATLLILLIAIGGAVGLPLVGAAAAWERNGSLDAISRAFSYIFARPLQFFWNYFLIFLMTAVIVTAGGHFERILEKSVGLAPLEGVHVADPQHADRSDERQLGLRRPERRVEDARGHAQRQDLGRAPVRVELPGGRPRAVDRQAPDAGVLALHLDHPVRRRRRRDLVVLRSHDQRVRRPARRRGRHRGGRDLPRGGRRGLREARDGPRAVARRDDAARSAAACGCSADRVVRRSGQTGGRVFRPARRRSTPTEPVGGGCCGAAPPK